MKKILIPMIAVSALAATTVPALAQPGFAANQRQVMLERRIDQGVRNHTITRAEAMRLHAQINQVVRLEMSYRRGGLSAWERNDLDRRFDRISTQIRIERRDRDYGYGYGHGPRR